jgi:RNA polymerase sigma factor (sigma-70 family)
MSNNSFRIVRGLEKDLSNFYVKKKHELIRYFGRKYTSWNSYELEEVFQDAFSELYEKILKDGDFHTEKERANYFFGIMENMIKTENRRIRRLISNELSSVNQTENNIEELYRVTENLTKSQIVKQFVKQLSDPCKTILQKFYLEELSYAEVLKALPNFSNTNALKAQKYKCMKRFSEPIKKILKYHDLI